VIIAVLWWRGAIGVKAIVRGGMRGVEAQPAWVWACGAVLVFLAGAIAAGAAAQLQGVPTGLFFSSPKAMAIVQLSSYGAAMLAVVFLLRVLKDAAPKAGLVVDGKSLLLGLWCGVLAFPVLITVGNVGVAVQTWLGHKPASNLGHPLLVLLRDNPDNGWAWLLGVIAVVAAPVVEETLYRGLIQSCVLRVTGMPWVSVATTSVVFMLMHYQDDGSVPWAAMVEIGVFGAILGFVFERTKRLGVTIAMHVFFNAANLAIAMWAI
jgi:membrane protease YdiL (CAAX protease family)